MPFTVLENHAAKTLWNYENLISRWRQWWRRWNNTTRCWGPAYVAYKIQSTHQGISS